ncbi:MAG: hypothetical protein AB1815_05405 [Bacillota bacterium]
MYNRFNYADHTSSAFSIGFGILSVAYLKSYPFIVVGLIFISIGMISVNEYSVKNITGTLKLICLLIIPMEIIIAVYAFSKIDRSYFLVVTMLITLANIIVITTLKRRHNVLIKLHQ